MRAAGDSSLLVVVALGDLALFVGLTIPIVDRRWYLVRWPRMEAGGPMTSNVLVTLIGTTTVALGGTALVVVLVIWLR